MKDLEGKVPQIEGNFTALSLVSLIQGISANKRMLITLYSIEGNEGRLYFENSRIVGAFVSDDLKGKKAFFRMIEWEDARFQAYDITEIDPERINIDLEVSHLLLEGLRQKDEKAKIKNRILPIYKITRADGEYDLSDKENDIFSIIPADGIFVNTLVNMTKMTDWEAYTSLSSLMIKRAIVFVKIKTLVIDDSEFMTKILRDILDNLFKDVLIIKTLREGSEAIKLINSPEKKVRPDLIFTDIVMEQTSGMEVIKAARTQDPPILTIAITSLQREMKDILDAGANYLHKNWITRDTIGEVMRDLVERTICGEVGVIGGETYVKPTII